MKARLGTTADSKKAVSICVKTGVISFACVLFVTSFNPEISLGFAGLLAGFVATLLVARYYPKIAIALMVAYGVRAAAAVLHRYVFTLPQSSDARAFESRAHAWSLLSPGDTLDRFTTDAHFISWLGSWLYKLTAPSPLMLQSINVIIGTLVVLLVYKLTLHLWNDTRIAVRAAWITALFPQFVLHSGLFLREIPVNFFLVLGLMYFVLWYQRRSMKYVIYTLLSLAGATAFHSGAFMAFPVVLAALLLSGLRSLTVDNAALFLRATAALIIVTGSVAAMNNAGWGLGKFGGTLEEAYATFEAQEQRGTRGGAAFSEDIRIRNPGELWKAPWRVTLFLFAPLPWMISSPHQVVGLIDSLLYMALLIALLRSWPYIRRNLAARTLAAVFATLVVVFALGVTNYGTAIRHRAKLAPLALSLMVVMPYQRRTRFASEPVGPAESKEHGPELNVVDKLQ